MLKAIALVTLSAAAVALTTPASAADAVKGRALYQDNCSACHGDNGVSVDPMYPNLAGQKGQYLMTQLHAFRQGTRKNEIMQPMAQGLTNIDIANVALYLSSMKLAR